MLRALILEGRGLSLSARDSAGAVAQLPYLCCGLQVALRHDPDVHPASQCDDRTASIDVALIKQELKDLNG